MTYLPLYRVTITQASGSISSSISGRDTAISSSWVKVDTGSFALVSSGSFSGASGSYTGSLYANIIYQRLNSSDTGSISIAQKDVNSMIIETSAYPFAGVLTDNVIKGTCSIDIGIYY